jgi:hypothetical protein
MPTCLGSNKKRSTDSFPSIAMDDNARPLVVVIARRDGIVVVGEGDRDSLDEDGGSSADDDRVGMGVVVEGDSILLCDDPYVP